MTFLQRLVELFSEENPNEPEFSQGIEGELIKESVFSHPENLLKNELPAFLIGLDFGSLLIKSFSFENSFKGFLFWQNYISTQK